MSGAIGSGGHLGPIWIGPPPGGPVAAVVETSLSAATLADSPTFYVRLNDNSQAISNSGALVIADLGPNAITGTNHGAYSGIPKISENELDRPAAFTTFEGYIDFGNPVALRIVGNITVRAMVRLAQWPGADTGETQSVILGKGYDGATEGYTLIITDDKRLGFSCYDGVAAHAVFYDISGWTLPVAHMIHGVFDGGHARLYLDGIEVASTVYVGGALATTAPFAIGKESVNGSYVRRTVADISEVAVWNSPLAPSRVLAQFNASKPSAQQIAYVSRKLGVFLHCTASSFVAAGIIPSNPTSGQWHAGIAFPSLNIDQWLDAVQSTGAKYAVLTTKHDLGGCIFVSATGNPRHIGNTAWYESTGIDLCAQFTAKCRVRGITPCFYLNTYDPWWTSVRPGFTGDYTPVADYAAYMDTQVRELLSNYGAIGAIWLDGFYTPGTSACWNLIRKAISDLQPHCVLLVNNHDGILSYSEIAGYEGSGAAALAHPPDAVQWDLGVGLFEVPPPGNTRPAEFCETVRADDFWEWRASGQDSLKSPSLIYSRYQTLIARNSAYLINLPPNTDGLLPVSSVTFCAALGALVNP